MSTAVEPKTTWRGVVRNRTFGANNTTDVCDILARLYAEKFTGKVTINMAQGSCRDTTVEDRAALST